MAANRRGSARVAVERAAVFAFFLSIALAPAVSRAETPQPCSGEIRTAIDRAVALIEESATVYRRERECFSCHHQALPVLTLSEARRREFEIDETNFQEQLKRTAEHLERGRESYRKGRGQGGKADTAGWALWTLETGGREPDETTAAVAEFLLSWQSDQNHWHPTSERPPTEASAFTTTYVALRGLSAFGTAEQSERVARRTADALKWLQDTEPKDTEDRVFRLRALHYLGADETATLEAARQLLEQQLEDGSWPQLADGTGDAYATGSVLVALHEAGGLATDDPVYRKGVEFLVRTQLEDGSWNVETRSKPIQIYFESGFPHAEDQFISVAASCWATHALLLTCPAEHQE